MNKTTNQMVDGAPTDPQVRGQGSHSGLIKSVNLASQPLGLSSSTTEHYAVPLLQLSAQPGMFGVGETHQGPGTPSAQPNERSLIGDEEKRRARSERIAKIASERKATLAENATASLPRRPRRSDFVYKPDEKDSEPVQSRQNHGKPPPEAAARGRKTDGSKSSPKTEPKCFKCGKPGHKKVDCRKEKNSRPRRRSGGVDKLQDALEDALDREEGTQECIDDLIAEIEDLKEELAGGPVLPEPEVKPKLDPLAHSHADNKKFWFDDEFTKEAFLKIALCLIFGYVLSGFFGRFVRSVINYLTFLAVSMVSPKRHTVTKLHALPDHASDLRPDANRLMDSKHSSQSRMWREDKTILAYHKLKAITKACRNHVCSYFKDHVAFFERMMVVDNYLATVCFLLGMGSPVSNLIMNAYESGQVMWSFLSVLSNYFDNCFCPMGDFFLGKNKTRMVIGQYVIDCVVISVGLYYGINWTILWIVSTCLRHAWALTRPGGFKPVIHTREIEVSEGVVKQLLAHRNVDHLADPHTVQERLSYSARTISTVNFDGSKVIEGNHVLQNSIHAATYIYLDMRRRSEVFRIAL